MRFIRTDVQNAIQHDEAETECFRLPLARDVIIVLRMFLFSWAPHQ